MPIGYLVVWIIALYDGREETIVNEELIQEGKKVRKKRWIKSERKRRKEHKLLDALLVGREKIQGACPSGLNRRRPQAAPNSTSEAGRKARGSHHLPQL
jgi:hypothetical protein